MKRVFEGKVGEDGFDRPEISVCFGEGWGKGLLNVRVRITVEDLPESKPEPINWLASGGGKSANTSDFKSEPKNCGNCALGKPFLATNRICAQCEKESEWQPKAAEPQGWEQRFDFEYRSFINQDFVFNQIKSFIRAELERVREEEKQAVLKRIDQHYQSLGVQMVREDIEQNRHRSEK